MAIDLDLAERTVIGCILLDAERCLPLAMNEQVQTDWFAADTRRLAWDAIVALWGERNPIDGVTVLARARRISQTPKHPLSGVELTPSEVQAYIDDTPTTAHFEYYLHLLRGEAMVRRIKKAGARFTKDIGEGITPEIATQTLANKITQIISATAGLQEISVGSVLDNIWQKYTDAHQKRIVEKDLDFTPGIPLPWKKPNTAMQGVQAGLIYLGARPSVGKTAFVLNLMRFWAERGVKIAFNSLDMAVEPMMKRPISELSRVSLTKASFGTTTHEDLEAMRRAIEGERNEGGEIVRMGVKQWPLKIFQLRDVDALRSWCKAAHLLKVLDIVVIDFVQLLTTQKRHATDNEKLEYVSGVLKSIAIDLNIPVIALSQLNRACEEDGGRVPTASDLRGSGALEQDATAVWILHNDREVVKTWNDSAANQPLGLVANKTPAEVKAISPVRFIIAKNQNGQAGPDIWFPFIFYKKYCLFMLANPDASPIETISGAGAAAKKVKDNSPLYAQITHDWRCDPFECVLKANGCLIGYDLQRDRFLLGD